MTLLHRSRQGHVVDLRRYDCDFWALPVDFYWSEGPRGDPKTDVPLKYVTSAEVDADSSIAGKIINFPWNLVCYGVAKTFGYRLLYPGTLGFIQTALDSQLQQGRAKLIDDHGG